MRELRVYKPTKAKSGSAASFQLAIKGEYKEPMVFLTLARQGEDDDKGNNGFKWKDKDNAVTAKLSELDAAKMLLVLLGQQKEAKIFHDPSKSGTSEANQGASKVVNLLAGNKKDDGTIDVNKYLSVSLKQGEKLIKIQLTLSQEEQVLLRIFLQGFIEKYYLGD